jgi:hypothetical protein
MMIVLIITRAIGSKPVCSFDWWPQHMQRSAMRGDDRTLCHRVRQDDPMKQFGWNLCTTIERYRDKRDSTLAVADEKPFFWIRERLPA